MTRPLVEIIEEAGEEFSCIICAELSPESTIFVRRSQY